MDENIYAPPQAALNERNDKNVTWVKGLLIVASSAWTILGAILVYLWMREILLSSHGITFNVTNVALIMGSIFAVIGGIFSGISNRIGPPMLLGSFIALTLNTQWGGLKLSEEEILKFLLLGISVSLTWYAVARTRKYA